MATHSSVLAWRVPGTGEPGGLPSMGSQRVGHDSSDLATAAAAATNDCNWTCPSQSLFTLTPYRLHSAPSMLSPLHSPVCVCVLLVDQSCPTLCNPMDCSSLPPAQASLSMEFSRQGYWNGLPFPSPNVNQLLLSCFSRVRLCATPQTAAHQAPMSLGFSRQRYWSGLPFPSPTLSCSILHLIKKVMGR